MLLYFIACFTCLIRITNQFDGFLNFFDRSRNHVTAPTDLEDLEPGSYDDILHMNPDRYHDPQEIYDIRRYQIPEKMSSSIVNAEDQPQATSQTEKMYNKPESKTLSPFNYLHPTEELAVRTSERPAVVRQQYKMYEKSAQSTASPYSDTYYNKSSGRRAFTPDYHYTRDYPHSKGIARDERKRGEFLEVAMWDFDMWESYDHHDVFGVKWKTRKPYGAYYDYELQGTYLTSCYTCGHLEYGKWWKKAVEERVKKGKLIPNETLCADAFDSDDWRARTKRLYLREECYNNTQTKPYTIFWNTTKDFNGKDVHNYRPENYHFFHDCVKVDQVKFGIRNRYQSGMPLTCFGPYVGRCFKRFLDVGKVYTERGCLSWPPHKSNTFASHRFEMMEYLLNGVDEGCVSSPIASLTPFSRSVSLYVRYHVCVCKGSYCNAATQIAAAGVAVMLLLFAKFSICFY